MGNILDVDFGLVFWTIVNFSLFLFLLLKFGTKPIANALKSREEMIKNSIDNAEKANLEAKELLNESKNRLGEAQQNANDIISKSKQQVEVILSKAKEEAEVVKNQKIQDAVKEIDRSKEKAIVELRTEVADLVIQATEKILIQKIDKSKDMQFIEESIKNIEKISNN